MQMRTQLLVILHPCQHELYFGANRLAILCLQVCNNQNTIHTSIQPVDNCESLACLVNARIKDP